LGHVRRRAGPTSHRTADRARNMRPLPAHSGRASMCCFDYTRFSRDQSAVFRSIPRFEYRFRALRVPGNDLLPVSWAPKRLPFAPFEYEGGRSWSGSDWDPRVASRTAGATFRNAGISDISSTASISLLFLLLPRPLPFRKLSRDRFAIVGAFCGGRTPSPFRPHRRSGWRPGGVRGFPAAGQSPLVRDSRFSTWRWETTSIGACEPGAGPAASRVFPPALDDGRLAFGLGARLRVFFHGHSGQTALQFRGLST